MHYPQLNDPRILFKCSDEGVYFGDVKPTAFSLGVLIEIEKDDSTWHGTYLVYHYSASALAPQPSEMVSSKISFKATDFPDLILSMRDAFNALPKGIRFTNEERAAIEVAAEMKWHFPKKMIGQLDPMKRSGRVKRRQMTAISPRPQQRTKESPTMENTKK